MSGNKSPRTRRVAGVVAVLAASGLGLASAHGSDISWVEWNASSTTAVAGSDVATGLAVSATYSDVANSTWAPVNDINISDSSWSFSNNTIKAWNAVEWDGAGSTANWVATGTFDFTNAGGLGAGGSIALIDVEGNASHPSLVSTIRVTGYQSDGGSGYNEVAVNWTYSYYTIDPNANQPTWNASTDTLTGGGIVGGWSSFAMLTSDVQLDRIVLDMDLANGDGIGIGFTQTNIAASAVPGAGLAGLATVGLAGVARRRRR